MKTVIQAVATATAFVSTAFGASGNFDATFDKLGFKDYKLSEGQVVTKERQEEALLNIFYMAGYFKTEKLWHDINNVPQIKDKKQMFFAITEALKQAGGDQEDYKKFDAAILRKSLSSAHLSIEWIDFLLYVAQNAFNRNVGQERNELLTQNWMKVYETEYLQEAKMLGLVDRKFPNLFEYDEAWIAGASRVGVLMRLLDYNYILSLGIKVKGDEVIHAGQRELWANIDGLNPKTKKIVEEKSIINIDEQDFSVPAGRDEDTINEGKEYMLELAKKTGIRLNEQNPFIEYQKGDHAIPSGRFPERVYANYADGEQKKLTESMMAADLLKAYVKHDISIIDTSSREGGVRPDTTGGALDSAKLFVEKIKSGQFGDKKHFTILYESNNPYIERQALAAQRVVNKVLQELKLDEEGYKIEIEGTGFAFKQDVVTIHSEFAALMAEKWKFSHLEMSEAEANEYLKPLLFQTRDNNPVEEPLPELLGVNEETPVIQDIGFQ
jgi:hypothetical protein